MKLATSTADFHQYTESQTEALFYVKEAGFSYADYNFHIDHVRKNGVYSKDFKGYFEKVANEADRLGIRLIQAHSPMGDPIIKDNSEFIADTIRCVDACGFFGINNLVIHSGYLEGMGKEDTLKENEKFFRRVLDKAEKYGINILVENFNKICLTNYYWIDNATDLLELIELVDHPLFHAVWDTGHANLQKMSQDDELRLLGSHVKALHVHDNMGDRDDHLLPFLGTMSLDSVMNGLSEIGYDGYFTFEVGGIFTPPEMRREFSQDTRLKKAPLDLKRAAEKYLYSLGKTVLESYSLFEE